MDKQLKRILDLVRRTGDRMVVTDPNGEDAYVVMGLDAYESLVEAQELFDDEYGEPDEFIPPEYGLPPVPESKDDVPPPPEPDIEPIDELSVPEQLVQDKRIWDAMQTGTQPTETWDLAALTAEELEEVKQAYEAAKEKNRTTQQNQVTSTPETTSDSQAEPNVPKKGQDDDEFGEEQFYLEPVE